MSINVIFVSGTSVRVDDGSADTDSGITNNTYKYINDNITQLQKIINKEKYLKMSVPVHRACLPFVERTKIIIFSLQAYDYVSSDSNYVSYNLIF